MLRVILSIFLCLTISPLASAQSQRGRLEVVPVEVSTEDSFRLPGFSVVPREAPKAVVLLVHGLQGNSSWFRQSGIMEELARLGIAVFAFDRRSTPRSVALNEGRQEAGDILGPADYYLDLKAAADMVLGFARDNNVKAHLVGESLGGILGYQFLSQDHCGFSSMVGINTSLALRRIARFDWATLAQIRFGSATSYFGAVIEEDLLARPSGVGENEETVFESFLRNPVSYMQRRFTARYLLWVRDMLGSTLTSLSSKGMAEFPIYWIFSERDQVVDSEASMALVAAGGAPAHRSFLLPQAAHIAQTPQLRRRLAMAIERWISNEHQEAAGGNAYFCEGLRR